MHKISGFKSYKRSHSGDDSNEGPPVPIPNTEVKLVYARCSWVLTLQDKVVAGFHLKSTRFHSENGCFSILFARIRIASSLTNFKSVTPPRYGFNIGLIGKRFNSTFPFLQATYFPHSWITPCRVLFGAWCEIPYP